QFFTLNFFFRFSEFLPSFLPEFITKSLNNSHIIIAILYPRSRTRESPSRERRPYRST
ncbi:unnamed protein product, partial [Arabidopsis halleri]